MDARQATRARKKLTSAAWAATMILLVVPLFALAATSPGRSAAGTISRFSNFQIEIWPEFDRSGAALVILNGELPGDISLPATVSLRIPASSGGPSAVAFAAGAGSQRFNLAYDRTDGDGFITLHVKAPERFIHVEFYDPLLMDHSERRYSYVWPGDAAVDRLVARLQEPAAASDVSVQPDLGASTKGTDGLLYRTADLGSYAAGKPLPLNIRYTKLTPRTSTEILGANVPDSSAVAASGSAPIFSAWVIGLAAAIGLSVAAIVGVLSWRRRERASGLRPVGPEFCSQCGNRLAAGDRFCSKCGAAVPKSRV